MEKDIPWKSKGNWRINSHIRQTDLKIKAIIREKEGHYKMIKRSTQEDVTIVNIYAPTWEHVNT